MRLAAGQELEHREAAGVEGLLPLPELHQDVDVACRRLLVLHHGPGDADAGHTVALPDGVECDWPKGRSSSTAGAKVLPDLRKGMHRYS